jgi:broad specificity phosphatase PhoE
MRVYLIRHGQTEWNTEGKAQGHTDVDLDKHGRAQANLVSYFFERRPVHRIISSDLRRCLATAEPTADLCEMEIETVPAIRERTFGELEGQHYTVIRAFFDGEARDNGLSRWEVRPRGGESLADVWTRITPVVENICAGEGDTVVFTHGGTCGLLLAQFLKAPIETALSFRFYNCSVTELKKLPSGPWQLVRYSDTRHLELLNEEPDEA